MPPKKESFLSRAIGSGSQVVLFCDRNRHFEISTEAFALEVPADAKCMLIVSAVAHEPRTMPHLENEEGIEPTLFDHLVDANHHVTGQFNVVGRERFS